MNIGVFDKNYRICLEKSDEELRQLLVKYNIPSNKLYNKSDICDALNQYVNFNDSFDYNDPFYYEGLPLELKYKINQYLPYREMANVAYSSQENLYNQTPYLVEERRKLTEQSRLKRQLEQFKQSVKLYINSNRRYFDRYNLEGIFNEAIKDRKDNQFLAEMLNQLIDEFYPAMSFDFLFNIELRKIYPSTPISVRQKVYENKIILIKYLIDHGNLRSNDLKLIRQEAVRMGYNEIANYI